MIKFPVSRRAAAPIFLFAALAAQAAAPRPVESPTPAIPDIARSLVRVNATGQSYDFFRPWMKEAPYFRKGIGVVIADGRVLVTAELVANHTYIELEMPASAEKAAARLTAVDYDCNLALIEPVDPAFLKDRAPIALDDTARVGDSASLVQLEVNGEVAQTPATITTISVNPYPLDHLALLTFRLSAPLQGREGSFSFPAVRNGRLLGLLMRYDARSQSADVIPAPVIARFLAQIKPDVAYTGFPRVGIAFSETRDPQLRRYAGIKEDGGVYITMVKAGSAADEAGIRKGDIILSVAGHPVDADGNYEDLRYGRIAFSHLTNTVSSVGDTIDFALLREGKRLTIPVKLAALDRLRSVSDPYIFDRQPRYLIVGGLVFQELSRPYLFEWGGGWRKEAPQQLVYLDAYQEELPADRGKIIFLSQILPTADTVGYEDLGHLVVSRVNGLPIKSLGDLDHALASPQKGFHKIEFDDDPAFIYLDAAASEKSGEKIRQAYGIPSLKSLD